MSSMLRSLRFVRRLNLGTAERRLGASLHRAAVPEAVVRCLANVTLDRNYVTKAAAEKADFTGYNLINEKLSDIDRRIRSYNNIYKKDVEEVLEIATNKGTMDSSQALLLIRCCGEFLFNESVQTRRTLVNEIWKAIKTQNVALDVSHYNALLLVNLENGVEFSPVDILLEMKDQEIIPNRVTFQRLIEQYCNKGDIAGATKILEHMNQQDIPINETIFITLMKGHSNAGDKESAVKLMDVMKQAGIEPSSNAYSALMCVYAKVGDLESIMKVLNECKEKDVLLSDKEILDVVYTLNINNHSEHVDKLMEIMPKEGLYNKTAVLFIHKLLEKELDEAAYKLLKSLIKNHYVRSQSESNVGHFFIRKLVLVGSDVEKIIKYCRLMAKDNLNSSAVLSALNAAYINNFHSKALPLLKELKESGGEIRVQYFYPILVHQSKKNLQDLGDCVNIIKNDYNLNLDIHVVKDFIVPNLQDNYAAAAQKLSENGLSFIVSAHAIVIHLLENNKLDEAYNFMRKTNMWYRIRSISQPLIEAFLKTKDVYLFTSILHFMTLKLIQENTSRIENELSKAGNEELRKTENESVKTEQFLNPLDLVSNVVARTVLLLSPNEVNIVEEILEELLKKGVNINEQTADIIRNRLGEKLNSTSEETLSKLVSEKFENPVPITKIKKLDSKLNYIENKSKEFIEFKMLLIQEHAKMMNRVEVEKLLKELEQQNPLYTTGFCSSLFDYYSKISDISNAEKWFNRFHELNPNNKISRSKILHYARALIQARRPNDALKVLEHPVSNELSEKDELSIKLMNDVLLHCPENIQQFFNVLKQQAFFVKLSAAVLGPLVKVHLLSGDIDTAIEKFKWCYQTYNFAPMRRQLMKELIWREDAKALQHVTDLVTRIHDEIQALHDLAFAFFECDRPRQARKILETPGFRLRIQTIFRAAEMYSQTGEVERLENFVNLFHGLYVDLDPLYYMLLKCYEIKKDWQKCLALWTEMQEKNIQPSSNFMIELDRILKKYNQSVPFTISQKASEVSRKIHDFLVVKDLDNARKIINRLPRKERPTFLPQLILAYAGENDTTSAVNCISELIDLKKSVEQEYFDAISSVLIQLGKKDDFPTIVKLLRKIQDVSKKQKSKSFDRTLAYFGVVNEVYLESGQFSKLIEHLDALLSQYERKTGNEIFINPLIITILLRGLQQHPEVEDRFREYAAKALTYNYLKPMSALWIHQVIQDSPEAAKTWNAYLSETPNIYPISAVLVCIERKAFEKIPIIAEKVQQVKGINQSEKRRMFTAILKTVLETDYPQKHDIAFECLRHANKVISVDNFNARIINEIQENVTNGQTIKSLKIENERTKIEVTG